MRPSTFVLVFALALDVYSLDVSIVDIKGYTLLRSSGKSALYEITTSQRSSYASAPLLIELTGTRYGMHWFSSLLNYTLVHV